MDKVAIIGLGYIGIGVRDKAAWCDLAGPILGLEIVDDGGLTKLRMDDWHNRIIMYDDPSDELLFAGLRVAGPEEFSIMQRQLREAGVSFEVASADQAAERKVLEYLSLQDPAGVPLEIFHGPQVDRHRPFRPGRGMFGKFVTGSGGMGHMIIRDAGGDRSYRFYRDVMGMRGSIEQKLQIGDKKINPIFMHCNERDHTIAFGSLPLQKHVSHLMIELDNLDDVGMAYDLVQRAKIPIDITLGRHSNDNSLSFYLRTPSGWRIEYGYGGSAAKHESEYCVAEIWGHEFTG